MHTHTHTYTYTHTHAHTHTHTHTHTHDTHTHTHTQSSVNKMSLPNLVIVFSPTLQIPAPILHALYHNSQEIFADIELTK